MRMKKAMRPKVSAKAVMSSRTASSYLREPYARILVPEEEGGFSAEILEFPGCYAQGDSPEETYRNLDRAAESWIEAALEQGQEIPPPSANQSYSGRIALRLPPDLHRAAIQKAQRDGVSLNQCLVTAVATWIGADDLFERLTRRLELPISKRTRMAG
jgi:antitoxin HicB